MQAGRILFLPVLGLACAACSGIALPEDRGTQLTAEAGDVFMPPWYTSAWSPDGRELYYLVYSGPHVIRAVDVTSATSREVWSTDDDEEPGIGISTPVPSPDGTSLYFHYWGIPEHDSPTTNGIFRVAVEGGTPELVLEGYGGGGDFAISPDGGVLAGVSEEGSLAFFDLETQLLLDMEIATSRALRFSPDGTQLLVTWPDEVLAIMDVDGGTPQPLYSEGPGPNEATGLYWDESRIELVYAELHDAAWRLTMIDASGSASAITEAGALEDDRFQFREILGGALSRDGAQAALWAESEECVEEGIFGCTRQYVLVLVDIASGSTETIGATQTPVGSQVVFSPDGSQLIYDGGDGLYLKAVP